MQVIFYEFSFHGRMEYIIVHYHGNMFVSICGVQKQTLLYVPTRPEREPQNK